MADIKKVINGLECCLKESDHLYSNPCNGCPYEGQECIDRMKTDALDLLLDLLKKREATKPIYNEEEFGDHLPHCSNCKKALPNKALYGKVKFCHYCGQAVKWR